MIRRHFLQGRCTAVMCYQIGRTLIFPALLTAWLINLSPCCLGQPILPSVTLEMDAAEVLVGDPVLLKIRISNDGDHAVTFPGVIPSIEGGRLGIQFRRSEEQEWASFTFSHVTIEPGALPPEAKVALPPKHSFIYYECLAYRTVTVTVPVAARFPRRRLPALGEPGEFEFRAIARFGNFYGLSQPVKLRAVERAEPECVALDLGEDVLHKAIPLDAPGLRYGDRENAEKVEKYLHDSRAGWFLRWKSAWATWMEADDLVRPRAARESIIGMRDAEKGIAREILTLSLAHGYLKMGDLQRARAEAETVPAGSIERRNLLHRIAEAEAAAPRRPE